MTIKKPFVGILAFLIVLFTMPIGHAVMIIMEKVFGYEYVFIVALLLGLIGVVLLVLGVKNKNETKATFYGIFAGLFIWTGWIEFAFVYIAQKYDVSPLIENGEVVTKPEYLIMPSSIGFLFVFLIYFLLNGKTQCRFFTWWQKLFKLDGASIAGANRGRSFALISAMEMIMILWTFYMVLLIVYDKTILGDRHPVTYIVAFSSLLWSLYLFIKLIRIRKLAYALRYSIPTVIIFWNFVEILGRWDIYKEIWVEPGKYWIEMVSILFVFLLLFGISLLERKKSINT
ncbi:MAG: hypothetical protein U9Q21_01175 [Candidatus Auribacterota bacterium]|nr:hypothetical protein [Candidatus Auribacterota bacterium]